MQPPIKLKAPGWLSEFQAFIMRGSVVDLAVGIIIGAAFTGVVNSLVKDIFNPVIGLLIGGVDFSNVFFSLNGQHYASLAEAQHAGAATVNIGLFINTIIQFIIVGFTIFWTIKVLSRLHLTEGKKAPPPPPKSDLLLEEIRDLLKEQRPAEKETVAPPA
jgi:large conductance mechanosensitive channel